MPKNPQWHSAALRGALWITLIALLATGAAMTVQYLQTTRLVEARMRALVDDEATSLVARYRDAGLNGVAGAINRQQQLPRLNEFFYLLAAPDGTPLAGNLLAWPLEVDRPGFHSFTTGVVNTRGRAGSRWVDARAVALGGGYRLLVGNFADERAALRQQWLKSMFWSLLVTGVLGLALGWWYSRRGLRFVDQVSDAGDRFLAGRFGERVPVSPRADEYDRLAETFNLVFAEVERLIGSLRATTDALRASTDGMAHDLKTPLTRIRARLELADMKAGDDAGEILADSRRDLDALLDIIDGALGLARAEATATFAPLSFDAIITEAVDLYRPLAEDKNIKLVADLEPATLTGARSLLAQMTANLLDNALKFTPEGGTVEISVKTTPGQTRLMLTDTGPGIPEADRLRVQERFTRLDRDLASPGTGIGLSLVAIAARVHRATLTLSDNNPGLKVTINFPSP